MAGPGTYLVKCCNLTTKTRVLTPISQESLPIRNASAEIRTASLNGRLVLAPAQFLLFRLFSSPLDF